MATGGIELKEHTAYIKLNEVHSQHVGELVITQLNNELFTTRAEMQASIPEENISLIQEEGGDGACYAEVKYQVPIGIYDSSESVQQTLDYMNTKIAYAAENARNKVLTDTAAKDLYPALTQETKKNVRVSERYEEMVVHVANGTLPGSLQKELREEYQSKKEEFLFSWRELPKNEANKKAIQEGLKQIKEEYLHKVQQYTLASRRVEAKKIAQSLQRQLLRPERNRKDEVDFLDVRIETSTDGDEESYDCTYQVVVDCVARDFKRENNLPVQKTHLQKAQEIPGKAVKLFGDAEVSTLALPLKVFELAKKPVLDNPYDSIEQDKVINPYDYVKDSLEKAEQDYQKLLQESNRSDLSKKIREYTHLDRMDNYSGWQEFLRRGELPLLGSRIRFFTNWNPCRAINRLVGLGNKGLNMATSGSMDLTEEDLKLSKAVRGIDFHSVMKRNNGDNRGRFTLEILPMYLSAAQMQWYEQNPGIKYDGRLGPCEINLWDLNERLKQLGGLAGITNNEDLPCISIVPQLKENKAPNGLAKAVLEINIGVTLDDIIKMGDNLEGIDWQFVRAQMKVFYSSMHKDEIPALYDVAEQRFKDKIRDIKKKCSRSFKHDQLLNASAKAAESAKKEQEKKRKEQEDKEKNGKSETSKDSTKKPAKSTPPPVPKTSAVNAQNTDISPMEIDDSSITQDYSTQDDSLSQSTPQDLLPMSSTNDESEDVRYRDTEMTELQTKEEDKLSQQMLHTSPHYVHKRPKMISSTQNHDDDRPPPKKKRRTSNITGKNNQISLSRDDVISEINSVQQENSAQQDASNSNHNKVPHSQQPNTSYTAHNNQALSHSTDTHTNQKDTTQTKTTTSQSKTHNTTKDQSTPKHDLSSNHTSMTTKNNAAQSPPQEKDTQKKLDNPPSQNNNQQSQEIGDGKLAKILLQSDIKVPTISAVSQGHTTQENGQPASNNNLTKNTSNNINTSVDNNITMDEEGKKRNNTTIHLPPPDTPRQCRPKGNTVPGTENGPATSGMMVT